ncbi:hypothetical protein BB8028_0006g10510 [Beauveria bassiana]|uniref:Uncharacterized protein n=2 Tax=Beauveria bassiana TaxID=176275 RepID=J4KNB7_BEAB2|nr:uncharacterized protein BBA_05755 [Beauveria bassiana ARSEF 2860]EJP65424.1 hypothetical protein BBA_05755 [Beauveria bassiana ARSEF 2860]KAF1732807.1 hypothetical protein CRV24_006699 [Beauveria bassiana]KAH8713158.1 hypothetical protein HC256_006324 [Beauveria bassiana]PQK16732.1 hypothetical protein BB8028_0006g10510 [Beauveria bassiana]
MSASKNADSVVAEHAEIHSRVPPSEPLTRKGHAPGVLVGNDRVPDFEAETYPPGTAPASQTFRPNPQGQIPAGSEDGSNGAKASSTIAGATSADVHQGLGHPGSGQTSKELHGGHRKKEGHFAAPANGNLSMEDSIGSRKLDVGREGRGKASENYPTAGERVPESAETVAAERN